MADSRAKPFRSGIAPFASLRRERGVAIMLVLFIVILTTALVTSLARSTYLGGRVNSSIEKGLKAEYLAKSALSFAKALIAQDDSVTVDDRTKDAWAMIPKGFQIPAEVFGIEEPNVKIQIEINPLGSKFPLAAVATSTVRMDEKWAKALVALFRTLGFDTDNQVDQDGPFKGTKFGPEQLVLNYIDYVDEDHEPQTLGSFTGVEDDSNKDSFPGTALRREEDLGNIPGFTPARVLLILPYVTADSSQKKINANFADAIVLNSILGAPAGDEIAAKIALDNRVYSTGAQIEADSIAIPNRDISPDIVLSFGSTKYQVITKVDYGTVVTFLKATLTYSGSHQAPTESNVTLY